MDVFSPSLDGMVFRVKDSLKKQGASIRVVQHENGRIKTATTIHEKLITQGVEIMIIPTHAGLTVARTVWVQDIESYAARDMDRERSMVVGMMPPKIAQIMINLATGGETSKVIWDPFCGLGTTLIEALHGGYTKLLASDLSAEMVVATQKNLANFTSLDGIALDVFQKDAKHLDEYSLTGPTMIVTEGMLGRNFRSDTISHGAILQERKNLTDLYHGFLISAGRNSKVEKIVCCLPFWNIGWERIYMPEIELLTTAWTVDPLSRAGKRYLEHMRPGQFVGREIVCLTRK